MDALLWTNKEAAVLVDEQEDSGIGFQPSRYSPPNGRDSICLGREAEKATAPHSSTLAWKIPRTEEPGRLQSMGLLRVGHD